MCRERVYIIFAHEDTGGLETLQKIVATIGEVFRHANLRPLTRDECMLGDQKILATRLTEREPTDLTIIQAVFLLVRCATVSRGQRGIGNASGKAIDLAAVAYG